MHRAFHVLWYTRMKKSQIQSFETIAVLMVFFIIVFIGIIFYSNIAKSSIEQKIDRYQELSKIQKISTNKNMKNVILSRSKPLSQVLCTVGSHPHEPHETRSIKIWSATFSKILQASELLGTNAIQFYVKKEAFDQILESGTASPSLSLWGHLNSLIEAGGQFFLYWVIIQPVLVVCTLFQYHITTRSEIKAKIRFCIYLDCIN